MLTYILITVAHLLVIIFYSRTFSINNAHSGRPVGGKMILIMSLIRHDFMMRSLAVVYAREGEAFTYTHTN